MNRSETAAKGWRTRRRNAACLVVPQELHSLRRPPPTYTSKPVERNWLMGFPKCATCGLSSNRSALLESISAPSKLYAHFTRPA